MSNPEIAGICKNLKSEEKVMERAHYFLQKLNNKSDRSMVSMAPFKYLICVDLAYRDLGLQWNMKIADMKIAKSQKYKPAFYKIQEKLNISNFSFEYISKQYKCNQIKSMFLEIYEQYQTTKLNSFPSMQRSNVDLQTPYHKTAVFYFVAKKHGKIKMDKRKLCKLMHLKQLKFKTLCDDVEKICVQSANNTKNSNNNNNNNNSRKRKRNEMEMEEKVNENMFCNGNKTRKPRKYKKYRMMIANGNRNKRRRMMIKNNNERIKKKKDNGNDIKNDGDRNNLIEINDDIDLKEKENDNVDNVENVEKSNNANNGSEANVNLNENESISAPVVATKIVKKRKTLIMTKQTVNDNKSNENE